MSKPDPAPEVEVVFLGPVTLSDKKKGTIFIPRETLDAHPGADRDAIWKLMSPFPHRAGLTVGAIYKGTGTIEDGKLQTLGLKGLRIAGYSKHAVIAAYQLDAAAQAEEDKLAALERKIKGELGAMGEIRELARLFNQVPLNRQAAAERAILTMIRTAARDLRQGRL